MTEFSPAGGIVSNISKNHYFILTHMTFVLEVILHNIKFRLKVVSIHYWVIVSRIFRLTILHSITILTFTGLFSWTHFFSQSKHELVQRCIAMIALFLPLSIITLDWQAFTEWMPLHVPLIANLNVWNKCYYCFIIVSQKSNFVCHCSL